MFRFTTKSGSVYQVDPSQKFFRKVGENWRRYEGIPHPITVGLRATFVLADGQGLFQTTRVVVLADV